MRRGSTRKDREIITAKQFIEACKNLNIRATEVPDYAHREVVVVNIWGPDPEAVRKPLASVNWPDPDRPVFNNFAWGHKYEFTAPADSSAEALIEAVVASGVLT